MNESKQSTTAQRVAIRRALHQILDNPRIFEDPLALHVIGNENALALQADPHRFETTPISRYLRAFVAARSRYAEDELAAAVRNGVSQYVVLGAGLDTFAYRNPYPRGVLRIFEVDHPATQNWKKARLEEACISLPPDLTFAPVDFEAQTLGEALRDAGYDPGECTFFSWLGVTEYLTSDSVMATFRFVASAPAGSEVVFDYMIAPSLLTPPQRARFEALAQRVASVGEPWHSFFDPQGLERDLRAMGFVDVEDSGPEKINERYFKDREDGLRVGSLSHLMKARR
jgi:methyltransferase (TIGR00027 family)